MAKSFKILDPRQRPETPSTSESSSSIDWTKCILCQETSKELLRCPADSKRTDIDIGTLYDYLAGNLIRFKELQSLPDHINLSRLDNGTGVASTLMSNAAKWHKKCKDKYNNTKLQRVENRKRDECETNSDSPKKKVTRYSSGGAARTSQDTCFLCGEKSDKLHKASTEKLDRNVRRCAEIVRDHMLVAKLSAGDMMSQDAMYHSNCLKTLYKKAESVNCSDSGESSSDKQLHGIALAELLSYIEDCRAESMENDVAPVFKLADLNQMYTSRLNDVGADTSTREHSTRLKERILANIPDLQAHKQGRNVLLAFQDDMGLALKRAFESDFDEEAIVLAKAAEIVRKDILKLEKSVFMGKFSKECQHQSVSKSLTTLVRMIMGGSNIVQQSSNATDTQAILTVSQLIRQNVIIRRREESTSHYYRVDRETPLPIYVGLLIHARTRKRELIDRMYDLGLSVSCDRVLTISKDFSNEVWARYEAEHVVCPANLRHGLFTTSAVDNIDHNPTSTTTQGAYHGTGISLFQHPNNDVHGVERDTEILRQSESKEKTLSELPEEYTSILPASLHTKEPTVPEASVLPPASYERMYAALQDNARMRYVAAYLLATLGGNSSPTAADIRKILDSVGIETEDDKLTKVINELKGKNVNDVISAGFGKLSSMPAGGAVAAPASAGQAVAVVEKAPAEEKKEEKEESEESDDDMGFGLFD